MIMDWPMSIEVPSTWLVSSGSGSGSSRRRRRRRRIDHGSQRPL